MATGYSSDSAASNEQMVKLYPFEVEGIRVESLTARCPFCEAVHLARR